MSAGLYEQDFLRWTEEQAVLIRSGEFAALDYAHILEELEAMGNEQKVALRSLLRMIIVHLLKLQFSVATDPRAKWIEEIGEFRAQAETRLEDTPSLQHYAEALFAKAWPQARRIAKRSFEAYNEQVSLPSDCPYTLAQVLDTDYFP